MITLQKNGNAIQFVFDDNSGYLQNGTIEVPVNSLTLVMDSSDMATFKKSATNDIFVSALYSDFGMSRSELESWYKDNMVGSTGGGGVTPEEVEEMIGESISGKADSVSAVTSAEYVSSSTTINFKNADGDVISSVDASDFVVDGMVENVEIKNVEGTQTFQTGFAGSTQLLPAYQASSYNTSATNAVGDYTSFSSSSSYAYRLSVKVMNENNTETTVCDKVSSLPTSEYATFATQDRVLTIVPASGYRISYVNFYNQKSDGSMPDFNGHCDWTITAATSCLVITFNTDAGKQDINIPLTQIFNPADYYTKAEVNTVVNQSTSGKVNTTTFTTYTANTQSVLSGAVTDVKILTVSQQNEVQLAKYTGGSTAHTYSGTIYKIGSGLTWDYNTKIISTDNTTIATKDDVASATSGKVDTTTFETYSGNVETALGGKQATLVSGTNIKTINNTSILGSGNIDIQGGSTYTAGDGIDITNDTISVSLPISAGTGTNALVIASDTFDINNKAKGNYSVCLNGGGLHPNYAYGTYSFAQGMDTKAYGNACHSEGYGSKAGVQNNIYIQYAHAEGDHAEAKGTASHAEGSYTIANNWAEHASGRYNISSSASTTFGDSGNTLFSVGNGTADNARHNAFEIRQNGDIYITSGGTNTSPSIKLQDTIGSKADKSDLGGLKLVKVTQAEYDALTTKDPNTLYVIVN